ncbi:MAG TPA: DNA primase [Candidatus Cybelea sp.]|nr:DNA primase [Candidatus Cybelea sp.]
MAFPPRFLDELRQRTSLAGVVGRRVRLIKRGREHVGLCPFHNEKSPSFTLSEDKGFFHCFGCGAHGDAIEFVRRSEGLSFPEAVERLAQEAGLPLPEFEPGQREAAERQASLQQVVEVCAAWFEQQLAGAAGSRARRYLEERGLSAETISRFRLGYAPDGRSALKQAMLARGITEAALVEAGMLIRPEETDEGGARATYDRFRDRITFPIADARGRVIAFGARAMGDVKPKYLNSPDTPLFHKGRVLYNLGLAREAARADGRLVVAEGYMDVIALGQAGIGHAVAPLGTALTEEQIALLWRLVPEPILCFDGDAAGLRAAWRAAERCLPLLKPGHSLRFALLPAGEDPDSLVKSRGKIAVEDVLAAALPLAELIWRSNTADRALDTPERRAALQQDLGELTRTIADETVRGYYRQWFRDRLQRAFEDRPPGAAQGRPGERPEDRSGRRPGAPFRPDQSLRGLRQPSPLADFRALRERLLLALIINHPVLLHRYGEAFERLDLASGALDRLRSAILHEAARNPDLDTDGLRRHLNELGLGEQAEGVAGRKATELHWFARPDAPMDAAEKGLRQNLARHRQDALRAELKAEEAALGQDLTEERLLRVQALKAQIQSGEGDEADLEGFGAASGQEAAP